MLAFGDPNKAWYAKLTTRTQKQLAPFKSNLSNGTMHMHAFGACAFGHLVTKILKWLCVTLHDGSYPH